MLRDSRFDLLRVIACFMVILLHVSARYVNQYVFDHNIYFTFGNFYNSISRVCVPIFVMISGTFLIDNDTNRNYLNFFKKTYYKIIIPTFIWSFLYFIFELCLLIFINIRGGDVNYLTPLINWINGKPYYHLWYLYMIIGLYFMTPFLIRIKNKIGEDRFLKLGYILIFLGIIIKRIITLVWYNQFIIYIGYFILGYSIRKKQTNSTKSYLFFIYFGISSLIIFFITELMVVNDLTNPLYFYDYLSLFVIIGSIAMFSGFSSMKKINSYSLIEKLTIHSFNIYVIHAGILYIFREITSKLEVDHHPIWYIPVVSILVFILSYEISIIVTRLIRYKKTIF